jgi:hypothetical protein
MPHLPIGGILNHLGIGLEQVDTQQPVVVRRLIFQRDSQPRVPSLWCACLGGFLRAI